MIFESSMKNRVYMQIFRKIDDPKLQRQKTSEMMLYKMDLPSNELLVEYNLHNYTTL